MIHFIESGESVDKFPHPRYNADGGGFMNGVIYARYSSDNQREESIEGQLRECQAFAEKNDITILNTYIDRAFSAKTDNRPEFQHMISDSKKKMFDVVLVWKYDRFARNRLDSLMYKQLLQRKLDRSKRMNNPDNYNEDKTTKKGTHLWIRSKRYVKTLFHLKEVQRKQAAVRKLQHELLANELLRQGDTFYVEAMNFKGLQARAKKTEKNEKGRLKWERLLNTKISKGKRILFPDCLFTGHE